ncbi:hypothetical protein CXG81DRAFT_18804 [Caulochytrium protostelioides]|uniref:Centrosomal protein of 70 kDa n=1 Tax=Caulochytrium protostelioides TaxID=1555241 RepID=A0A4P9X7Z5_9FUNG|nr:hypothetical protein CXG81DRAFT_18804 [Caulochytrium protostelioides]|eukprot:RKP01384.1 hypothetical protein CXG81DRAFT_18804 [Caulochytrium protostelioides]
MASFEDLSREMAELQQAALQSGLKRPAEIPTATATATATMTATTMTTTHTISGAPTASSRDADLSVRSGGSEFVRYLLSGSGVENTVDYDALRRDFDSDLGSFSRDNASAAGSPGKRSSSASPVRGRPPRAESSPAIHSIEASSDVFRKSGRPASATEKTTTTTALRGLGGASAHGGAASAAKPPRADASPIPSFSSLRQLSPTRSIDQEMAEEALANSTINPDETLIKYRHLLEETVRGSTAPATPASGRTPSAGGSGASPSASASARSGSRSGGGHGSRDGSHGAPPSALLRHPPRVPSDGRPQGHARGHSHGHGHSHDHDPGRPGSDAEFGPSITSLSSSTSRLQRPASVTNELDALSEQLVRAGFSPLHPSLTLAEVSPYPNDAKLSLKMVQGIHTSVKELMEENERKAGKYQQLLTVIHQEVKAGHLKSSLAGSHARPSEFDIIADLRNALVEQKQRATTLQQQLSDTETQLQTTRSMHRAVEIQLENKEAEVSRLRHLMASRSQYSLAQSSGFSSMQSLQDPASGPGLTERDMKNLVQIGLDAKIRELIGLYETRLQANMDEFHATQTKEAERHRADIQQLVDAVNQAQAQVQTQVETQVKAQVAAKLTALGVRDPSRQSGSAVPAAPDASAPGEPDVAALSNDVVTLQRELRDTRTHFRNALDTIDLLKLKLLAQPYHDTQDAAGSPPSRRHAASRSEPRRASLDADPHADGEARDGPGPLSATGHVDGKTPLFRTASGLSTRDAIRRDKRDYQLKLYKVDALSREEAQERLKQVCRQLMIRDMDHFDHSLRSFEAVVLLLPQLQAFIMGVDAAVWGVAPSRGSDDTSPGGESMTLPVNKLETTLKEVRAYVDKAVKLRQWQIAQIQLLDVDHEHQVPGKIQTLLEISRGRLPELPPDAQPSVDAVRHFQNLFEVARLDEVKASMNDLYAFWAETDSSLVRIRNLLRLGPEVRSPAEVLSAAINALGTVRPRSPPMLPRQDLMPNPFVTQPLPPPPSAGATTTATTTTTPAAPVAHSAVHPATVSPSRYVPPVMSIIPPAGPSTSSPYVTPRSAGPQLPHDAGSPRSAPAPAAVTHAAAATAPATAPPAHSTFDLSDADLVSQSLGDAMPLDHGLTSERPTGTGTDDLSLDAYGHPADESDDQPGLLGGHHGASAPRKSPFSDMRRLSHQLSNLESVLDKAQRMVPS